MSDLLPGLGNLASFGQAWFLLALLAVIAVAIVMAGNFAKSRREPVLLDLLPDEDEIDRVELDGGGAWDRLVLTDRRVIFESARWFLSERRRHVVSLDDVQDVRWRSGMNGLLLLAAAIVLAFLPPAGLVLAMLAVESASCATWFVIKHSRMPFLTHGVRARGRRALTELSRFHQRAHWAWARQQRVPDGTPRVTEVPPLPLPMVQGHPFTWGPLVWTTVVVTLAAAVVQRLASGHVSYDDLVFAPVYLALPVAAARFSLRDGLWSAATGFAAAWSIKFAGVLGERSGARVLEAAAILGTLLAVAAAAAALARRLPMASPLALLLWPAGALAAGGFPVLDARLAGVTLVAMALSILVAWTLHPRMEADHALA